MKTGLLPLLTLITACSESTPARDGATEDLTAVADWVSTSGARASADRVSAETADLAPVGDLIGGLEARLAEQPDDLKGWTLLARSYAYVGRLGDAEDAAERAVALGADAGQMAVLIARAHEGQ